MRIFLALAILGASSSVLGAQERPPIHLWFEPEWFEGVKGSFNYWTGTAKPTGAWGIAGPGISAEWSQGGESEWNSMGAVAAETTARCQRDFIVPRGGKYRVWVRYVQHRKMTSPFRVAIEQAGKPMFNGEYGIRPAVSPNDEYQLFWGFSFAWSSFDATLKEGSARLVVSIDKPGQAWRQVDAILVTDDLAFTPSGREKPRFAYQSAFGLRDPNGASWRGKKNDFVLAAPSLRQPIAGRDFSMWTGVDADLKWWGKQAVNQLSPYDVFFQFSPPSDIRDKFHKQFAGKKDIPIMSWPGLLPGFYLGNSPDLSDVSPIRKWLERTKTPFFIMTNYAGGSYTAKDGPGTYAALTGPLKEQFMGYIHGEAIGTSGISLPDNKAKLDRRAYVDALPKHLREKQAEAWSRIYKTKVAPEHWSRGIACLSVDSIALAHLYHESGARTVGYEIDATNVHVPMRIAFERGAARQYGGSWINYASGNFGDACNYFTQNPVVPRGAPSWFHSRYAITDGVSISWYRKLYYMNYLGGASAIYWEQNLTNQFLLPGPGTHPIQLSPFGRATEDFQAFASRVPDRGEPYTPIGLLLGYGHGYERVNYRCKMLHDFQEDKNDLELRELFNVCWHPAGELEGKPASPDVQSMPSGVFGDIFDVLVDRPGKAAALTQYPVVWAAGDVRLGGKMFSAVEDYVKKGGTLVVNVVAAKALPATFTGLKVTGNRTRAEKWSLDGVVWSNATPFEVADATLQGAKALAIAGAKSPLITRHAVGDGAVITVLVPHGLGLDERAHPCLPVLMNALTDDLLPVDVRLADGRHPTGEIMYSVNKTKTGWLVSLYNHRGIDKTQNGIARVDRKAFVDVAIRTPRKWASVREMTDPRDLAVNKKGEIVLRVPAGDLRVVALSTK
ncbi:MAG: hypothetical protein HYX68_05075 [Planctomycetes bacterium]|nr:hypothetical protein [Planctomycetota bacterium]